MTPERIRIDVTLFAVFLLTHAASSPTAEMFIGRDCLLMIFHPLPLTGKGEGGKMHEMSAYDRKVNVEKFPGKEEAEDVLLKAIVLYRETFLQQLTARNSLSLRALLEAVEDLLTHIK